MSKKQQLIDLVNEKGFFEVSKLLGLSVTELVLKTKLGFDSEIAYSILFELGKNKKLPQSYKEFQIETIPFDGVVIWSKKSITDYYGVKLQENFYVYATPFWDGVTFIPVDTSWYTLWDGEKNIVDKEIAGDYFLQLKTRSDFDGIEDLLTWYKHFYLPKVYEIITENFLVKIRNKIKDDLIGF
jgi:hypothetical protein